MLYFVIILSISLLSSQTTPTLSTLIHKIIFKRPSESDFAFLTGEDSNAVAGCSKEICDEKTLMLRLATLKVISPERIVLMFTTDNLNDLCRKLGSNIDEVKHEFKSCAPLKSDNLYWMLFRGVESMYGKICNSARPGKSLQNLVNNRDCIVELREEYIDCEGPADWFEKENHTTLCEIYHDILNCQFVKTAELCGMEVAHSLRLLTKTVFDGTLLFKCNVGDPPNIPCPMPIDDYSASYASKFYEPGGLEKWGDQIINTLSMMWNISYYTSPLILTFLYRRGYFVAEYVSSFAKISTGIGILVVISLCMRGIGRSQTKLYSKFVKALQESKANSKNEDLKNQLRLFDFEYKYWPVDFSVKELHGDKKASKVVSSIRNKPYWLSSLPCEIAAYLAIHTFGLRMIYPGSVKLIQSYLHPMLVQGRAKLIEQDHAKRYKLLTKDNNEVDSIFVDNRGINSNGKTLVICSEGNAGFYEIGIMITPMALKYSVLGWNHPGFGGSTGKPFPDQDQNAMDAVIEFAINKLGFMPENIVMFGWSIGGYSSLWAATQYPDIKGVILDATFDDVLHLALPRMPESLSGVVRIAIRQYINLHNSELLNNYNGSALMIRRTEDEVISENMDVATNRGNNLVINMLKFRFPNIFKPEQINFINRKLSRPIEKTTDNSTDQLCLSLLLSYVSEHGRSYPVEIGENYTEEQKNQMAEYLVYKHLLDYKSSHCTPLPVEYFQMPWALPEDDTDFVFT